MADGRGECRSGAVRVVAVAISVIATVTSFGSCRREQQVAAAQSSGVLRVGLGQVASANPLLGVRQLSQILSVEPLARPGEDGRLVPSFAESWAFQPGGRSLTIKLRPNVRFHDGTPADSATVAALLPDALRRYIGPVYGDVDRVERVANNEIAVVFRHPAPFLAEALEAPLQKGNGIATGAYKNAPDSASELIANDAYYLGAPGIPRVRVQTFPSIRSAWAEMLRGQIDMLYEVGSDALPSLQNANTVTVFTVNRPYQYAIILNSEAPALRSAAVRRALSVSLDRAEIVRNALNGFGVVSSGPIRPKYWASKADSPTFGFDPAAAAKALDGGLKFTCLIPPDAPFERMALEVKRQFAAVGVDMRPQQVSFDELSQRAAKRDYDALLIEILSGPTMLRPYMIWHSTGPLNWGKFGTQTSNAALDRVRNAGSEDEYRGAVAAFQQDFVDNPPAIFLAWSVRARAVSHRFVVPPVESGRDVMSTLRLWKPGSPDERRASRN